MQAKSGPIEWTIGAGSVPYPEAVSRMEARVDAITRGDAKQEVWLLEHPPLYTAGSSSKDGDLLEARFPVFRTGRGGQYTYHGPGQRVAYVMLDLKQRKQDVRQFVRDLEEWLIRALAEFNVKATIVAKNIGYELRCADPIPLDMEYARDLGYCAAKFLIAGGNAAMISMQGGHFVPVPFSEMIDGATGRTRVRLVDIASTRYAIARRYMIRLRRDDFEDPHELAKLAATARMTLEAFREQFGHLIAHEPPPLDMDEHGERNRM